MYYNVSVWAASKPFHIYIHTLELPQLSNQSTAESGLADEHTKHMRHQSESSIKKIIKMPNGHNSYDNASKS